MYMRAVCEVQPARSTLLRKGQAVGLGCTCPRWTLRVIRRSLLYSDVRVSVGGHQQPSSVSSKEGGMVVEDGNTLEHPVTCVGFSNRGIDAMKRLHDFGSMPSSTKLWCLDSDNNVLDAAKAFSSTLLIDSEKPLSATDVKNIIGRTASDAGGQGNIGSGDGCLAFIIAPSTGIPGGSEPLLQLTHSFRAAGHFTVAAVIAPFDFEGSLKKKQSRQLVNDLCSLAHLVVVLDQDVLLQQSYGEETLTVAESTEIANAALEHTIRCIVQAVYATEMLKSTQGGLMWHGKELKHFKRLISPPLQHLLTQKGLGVLGRGLALLPEKAASSMGQVAAMMHLASEAVASAAESPFVEGVLEKSGGVLCCLRMPQMGNPGDEDSEKACRMAAQAAAGALRTLTGKSCDEFLVCVEKCDAQSQSRNGTVQMEATMLLLWSDENLVNGGQKTSWKSSWSISDVQEVNKPDQVNDPQTRKQNSSALNSSSWGMLSALAGGEQASQKQTEKQQARKPLDPGLNKTKRPVVVRPTKEEKMKKQEARENVTVGDYLAESLTAQSLDLPPAAARWRQEHRSGQYRQRRLVVWEVDEEEPWESNDSKTSNPFKAILGDRRSENTKKVNVRDRVAGVLAQDRDEAWEAEVLRNESGSFDDKEK